jgi:hypothetical protein
VNSPSSCESMLCWQHSYPCCNPDSALVAGEESQKSRMRMIGLLTTTPSSSANLSSSNSSTSELSTSCTELSSSFKRMSLTFHKGENGSRRGLGGCAGNVRRRTRQLITITYQGPPTSDPHMEAVDLRCHWGI